MMIIYWCSEQSSVENQFLYWPIWSSGSLSHLSHWQWASSSKQRTWIYFQDQNVKQRYDTWFSIEQPVWDTDIGSTLAFFSKYNRESESLSSSTLLNWWWFLLLDDVKGMACKLKAGTFTRTINSCDCVLGCGNGISRMFGDNGII